MAREVKEVLDHNKAERHIRGGHATYIKYKTGRQTDGEPLETG